MDKEYAMEYYSVIKKNEILPFAMIWTELVSIMLTEISQPEKDKYHIISLMWNLRNKMNMQREKRERETKKQILNYREQSDGCQRGGGQEGGRNRCWDEGTCHDEHRVMYGSVESLYCTPETNITLYVN